MIRNYLKIAWRNILRHKGYALINVAGLALSLTSALLILIHVKEELSYDSFYPNADRIYRVRIDSQYGSNTRNWAASAPALGPMMQQAFPEIELAARLSGFGSQILSSRPEGGEPKRFSEPDGVLADASAVSLFGLRFLRGDPGTALEEPASIVLTAAMAKRFFGEIDPVGRTLLHENLDPKVPLKVTGVIADLPRTTHLKINYLVSLPTWVTYTGTPEIMNHRTLKAMWTYIRLREGASPAGVLEKAPPFMKAFLSDRPGRMESLRLQPIGSIHLRSHLEGEMGPNSDIAYIYIFSVAAGLLLLIAGINFVNLTTAQSFRRAKEVGIRKVIGARRGQLVKQHFGESFLLTAFSAAVSLGLLRAALPFYNRIAGKAVRFGEVLTIENAALSLALVGLLGFLAGLYPALFMSGFRPVQAVKSSAVPRSSSARLRKGLVVLQFVISILLVIGTITLYRQLAFVHDQDLGFAKDRLMAVDISGDLQQTALRGFSAFKSEILSHPAVSRVAFVSQLPGRRFSNERLTPVSVADKNTLPMLRFLRTDESFIETAGLTLVQGRDFDPTSDQKGAYIISESVMAALNLDSPLGVRCRSDIHGGEAPVVGVIKDFHFASLHNAIEPLVLEYMPVMAGFMLVNAESRRFGEVLDFLKAKIKAIAPDHLFDYRFVDEVFESNYAMEQRSFALFRIFSLLALVVACLGLFGLSVQAAETRRKEIGIRKALGASLPAVCRLLSGEFVRLVLAANLLAWPLAYLAGRKWLENFAYRVRLNLWMFLVAGVLTLLFAVGTVGSQALRAARKDLVEALRNE